MLIGAVMSPTKIYATYVFRHKSTRFIGPVTWLVLLNTPLNGEANLFIQILPLYGRASLEVFTLAYTL